MATNDGSLAISVIVPARDAEATLGRTLTALAAQDLDRPYEVIVVDAGSRDATAEVARAAPGAVHLVEGSAAGPAAARNRGVAEAAAPALAFIDADCFPTRGWLRAGMLALDRAALVQGAVLPDPQAALGPFDRTVSVGGEAGLYETASLFVRRAAFDRVRGFEEWLRPTIGAPHMAEDVLFGWRVRRAGERTVFSAEALVHHAVVPRGLRAFVSEHRRRRYFADIVREVPELRRTLCFGRVFLSRRTAAFDLALVGLAAAGARRSPLALTAALPYAALVLRAARRGPRGAPTVAAAAALADAVGFYSLVVGSVRRRTIVL